MIDYKDAKTEAATTRTKGTIKCHHCTVKLQNYGYDDTVLHHIMMALADSGYDVYHEVLDNRTGTCAKLEVYK